jgi:hypothetical protein
MMLVDLMNTGRGKNLIHSRKACFERLFLFSKEKSENYFLVILLRCVIMIDM